MAKPVMDIIKQTGKTIIFEKFNDEQLDLLTLLTADDNEIPIGKFVQELKKITVRSFEEFLEKFSPNIYELTTPEGKFTYSLEKPRGVEARQIALKEHAFYKMIMQMLDRKANSATSNLEFDYDKLKKMLTPESEMAEYKKLRKVLSYNATEYCRLVAEGKEDSAEAERFSDNISANLDKVVDKYGGFGGEGNAITMLPLFIADRQKQLDYIEELKSLREDGDEDDAPPALTSPKIYSYDAAGNIILIDAPKTELEEAAQDYSEEANKSLAVAIRRDFEKYAPVSVRKNEAVTDLVVNVFTANSASNLPTIADEPRLEQEKKALQDVYKSSLEGFIAAVSTIVEKFAGVKTFFDHATYKKELARDVDVIIANSKISDIVNDETAKARFEKYFTALSLEKDVNRIWFGIIPAVDFGEAPVAKKRTMSNPFERENRSPFGRNPKPKKSVGDLVSLGETKEMLKLLDAAKIMTFFNFKASEETGFVNLSNAIVDKYRKLVDGAQINFDHAALCFPNFTILPREQNVVKIGTEKINGEQKNVNVLLPGIYLEASYVAAGLMCGVQNYKLLESHRQFNVNRNYPCVRFDFEEGDNAKIILTKLNRETPTEMDQLARKNIFEDNFGFVFADNRLVFGNDIIENSYVLNARTLQKGETRYHSIFKLLVRNMILQLLSTVGDKLDDKTFDAWRTSYVDSWRRDNKNGDYYINRILYEDEDIKREGHTPAMKFVDETEYWQDVKIIESNN